MPTSDVEVISPAFSPADITHIKSALKPRFHFEGPGMREAIEVNQKLVANEKLFRQLAQRSRGGRQQKEKEDVRILIFCCLKETD